MPAMLDATVPTVAFPAARRTMGGLACTRDCPATARAGPRYGAWDVRDARQARHVLLNPWRRPSFGPPVGRGVVSAHRGQPGPG
jgi:hypothetical protein